MREPAGAEEAMTYDKRAEVQEARWDDRRLLCRDDNSHGQVTLLSGETKKSFGQPFRSFRSDGPFGAEVLCVYPLIRSYILLRVRETTHLVGFVQNDDLATPQLGFVVQLEDDFEQRTSRRWADETASCENANRHQP